jgi:hypothetical protein
MCAAGKGQDFRTTRGSGGRGAREIAVKRREAVGIARPPGAGEAHDRDLMIDKELKTRAILCGGLSEGPFEFLDIGAIVLVHGAHDFGPAVGGTLQPFGPTFGAQGGAVGMAIAARSTTGSSSRTVSASIRAMRFSASAGTPSKLSSRISAIAAKKVPPLISSSKATFRLAA